MKHNLKWLSTYIRPNKQLLILAIILMVAESYAYLATIWLQQILIDDVLIANQFEHFLPVILLMAGAFVAYSILFTLGPHTIMKTQVSITEHLVNNFMNYMYQIPSAILQKERTGTYVHYIVNDINKVGGMTANDIPRAVQQIAAALVLFGMVGFNSPIILVFSLFCCILYVWLGRYFSKKLKFGAQKVQETKSDLVVHIEEGISSTREVIAYHRMEWESKIYEKFFKKYFQAVMKEGKLVNQQLISSEPIKWAITLFILGYGGFLVLQGQMSIGVFVVLYQFSNQLVSRFQQLFNMAMDFSGKMASLERIRHVMDGPTWKDGRETLDEEIDSLQLRGVHFKYESETKDILHNITMDLPIGKKIAIVGFSGSGKSTIAQILLRFYEPSAGNIMINGKRLSDINRQDWINKISIVSQDPYLYPDTIRNNILLGKETILEEEMINICKMTAIHEYIHSLPEQYNTIIGERGITLSGGQRQRIAIARALIRDTEILILDESTSALDFITEKNIQRQVDQYRKGKTTIIIAHRLSTIKNADHIFVLDNGMLVEEGNHQTLLSQKGYYLKLVQADEFTNSKLGS
ncbi:ABC transporter ATP-binding protein [Oceanobacillus jeddahense]|uniref:ABC transporter ATP-binding protein/permease n=1 Tax=Oceanobacillus jeddahense TaxID=1462527 RepID=A0ABY5JWZ0_9BACI|nr:ABC transporter ATP-binding protein [Oceanobacillus jeddahense]UUI04851.1 ABC transporter ATP-binding protein/permease [Oceanobacillus jeddahense]